MPPRAATVQGRGNATLETIDADVQLKDWCFAPVLHPVNPVRFFPTPRPTGLGFRVVGTLLKGGKVTEKGEESFYSTEIKAVDSSRHVVSVNCTVYRLEGPACCNRKDIAIVPNSLKQVMEPFFMANWPSNAEDLFSQVSAHFTGDKVLSPTSPPVNSGDCVSPGTDSTVPRIRRSSSLVSASGTAGDVVTGTLPPHAFNMSPTDPQGHLLTACYHAFADHHHLFQQAAQQATL